jgi:hypothetical protein
MTPPRFLEVQDFSLIHSVETDNWAQPAYLMATGWVKWQEREVDHSLPSSAEIKKGGAIPPLPYISSRYSPYVPITVATRSKT